MAVHLTEVQEEGLQVSTITLDSPPVNVLDLEHCRDVVSCLSQIRADDRARVVIIRGAGRAFSAGVDILEHTPAVMPELLPAFHTIFHDLLGLRAVTVAAIHGICLGGGAEIALACDRVIAEENARIGFPEIRLGCYPPVALALVPYRAGPGVAAAMILGGDEVEPEQLRSWGLIDGIVQPGALDDGVRREIERYQGKSPAVLGMTAGLLHEEAKRGWGDRIGVYEREYLDVLLTHPDVAEGVRAFREKRNPIWRSPEEKVNPEDSLR